MHAVARDFGDGKADHCCAKAYTKPADVDKGILRKDVYDMAGQILGEWHRDIALSSTNVECYQKMVTPPVIASVNQRLMALHQLNKENKLSKEATEQAQAAIKSTLGQPQPEATDQLSSLLVQLLGLKIFY
jgi:hypothetical protein